MTLIISAACQTYALHVSDRQVTSRRAGHADKVHSPVENKTLIFLCRDAVGVIGYTGAAYVAGEPTDQWMARQLAPQPPGTPDLGSFGFGGAGLGNISLRAVIERLRLGLKSARLPAGARFLEVVVTGFRIRRGYMGPFQVTLSWTRDGPKQASLSRGPLTPKQSIACQLGDGFSEEELWKRIREGADVSGLPNGDEALRQGMISAVRVRASQSTTVGHDLTTVKIPNPNLGQQIEWSFESSAQHVAELRVGYETRATLPVVFSPWVIGPYSVICPNVGTGGMDMGCGGWTIRERQNDAARSSHSGPGILFATSHQPRTSPPR